MSQTLPLFSEGGGSPSGLSPTARGVAEILASSPGPWTVAQIRKQWPSRPAPKPAVVEAALGELSSRGAAHRLPGRGGKTLWSARGLDEWLREGRSRMLEAVRQAQAPVKENELLAASGWPKALDETPAQRQLQQMLAEGVVKAWPGRKPVYWRLSPDETVPEALLEALEGRALSRAEWLRRARAKLRGVSPERWQQAAAGLVAGGRVFQYTLRIDGKKVEACARAGQRAAFLELYRPMLERLKEEWRRLGAGDEQIARFLGGGGAPAAELLFEELKRLERDSPPPNPAAALRERPALRGLTKEEFDRAALELFRQGRIYMARHDHALRLPEEERRRLVADGEGNYYVSVTARQ